MKTVCSLEDSVTKDVENLALFEDVASKIAISQLLNILCDRILGEGE